MRARPRWTGWSRSANAALPSPPPRPPRPGATIASIFLTPPATIPADLLAEAQEHHDKMVELIAETDDELTTRYLEGGEITVDELMVALRAACLGGKLVPILCGSALRNKGVQPMLDAVIDYLPSPLDLPPVSGINPQTDEPELRETDDQAPFAALAFKIVSDPFVGRLCYFRVYSGVITAG